MYKMIKMRTMVAWTVVLMGVAGSATASITLNSWKELEAVLTTNNGAALTINSCQLKNYSQKTKTYDFTSVLQPGAALGNLDLSLFYNATASGISVPFGAYLLYLDFNAQGKRYVLNSEQKPFFMINISDGAVYYAKTPYYQKIQNKSQSYALTLFQNNGSKSFRIVFAQWSGSIYNNIINQSQLGPYDITNDIQKKVNQGGLTLNKIIPVSPFSDRTYNVNSVSIMFIINNVVYLSSFVPQQ